MGTTIMTPVEQIRAERGRALALIDQALLAAPANEPQRINALMQERARIAGAAFAAILASAEVAGAIAGLQRLTADMAGVAGHMVTAAEWLARIAEFLRIVGDVANALA